MLFRILILAILSGSMLASALPQNVREIAKESCHAELKTRVAKKIITDHGIKIELKSASRSEKTKDRKIIHQMLSDLDYLCKSRPRCIRQFRKIKIIFDDYLSTTNRCLPARQTRGPVEIARFCTARKSFSLRHINWVDLVHEVGHAIGNRGFYTRYNAKVPRKCKISKYATKGHNVGKRNEEFAEVLAAFFYATKKLKRKCRKAYNFVRDVIFAQHGPSC